MKKDKIDMANIDSRNKNAITAVAFSIAMGLGITRPVLAAEKYWSYTDCGSSFWHHDCWSATPGGALDGTYQPRSDDNVYLYNSSVNDYAVTYYNALYPTERLSSLLVDATSTGSMTLLYQNGNNLYTLVEIIGDTGSGIVTQTAGSHSVNNDLVLGNTLTGNGSFSLGNSGTLYAGRIFIGKAGTGNFDVGSIGLFTSYYGYLGYNSSGYGTATVSGTDSAWTNKRELYIGNSGTGLLDINNGGAVSNTAGILGRHSSGTGSVTVSDTNSTWINNGTLFVGSNGTGILNIDNGGLVSAYKTVLGDSVTAKGIATVSGIGSTLTWIPTIYGQGFYIGKSGTGVLDIDSGGSVFNAIGYLGYNSGASGTVTVSGTGSTWINRDGYGASSGFLFVGFSGKGILNIEGGGSVSNTYSFLGYSSSGSGTVSISGAGSVWSNSADLHIGNAGTGILNIDAGGSVSSTYGYLGYTSVSSGVVTITGTGSTWRNKSNLYIGNTGTGILNVVSGGSVSNNYGYLGYNVTSSGYATISGIGSTWVNNSLYIGTNGSKGILNINSGGLVSTKTAYIGGSGTVTVSGNGSKLSNSDRFDIKGILNINGGGSVYDNNGYLSSGGSSTITGTGSIWINNYNLYVGDAGAGILKIDSGGQVTSKTGVLGFDSGSNGSATINGTGSAWANSGNIYVGNYGSGDLSVDNGGEVSSNAGILGLRSTGNGVATVVGTDSSWAINGYLSIAHAGTGILNIESGGSVSDTVGYIGRTVGGKGTASVSGAGSNWTHRGSLYVGGDDTGAGGNGVLDVRNLGTVDVANTLSVWKTGTVNLDGGSINTNTLDIEGTLDFDAGTLNAGTTNLNGGTINANTLNTNGIFNFNAGTLNIAMDLLIDTTGPLGNNLVLNGSKTLNVVDTTTLGSSSTLTLDGGNFYTGTLINNGGFIYSNGAFNFGTFINRGWVAMSGSLVAVGMDVLTNFGTITGSGHVSAPLVNQNGGGVQIGAGESMQFTGTGNTNAGRIEVVGGEIEFEQGLSNQASGGSISVSNAVLRVGTGLLNQGIIEFGAGNSTVFGDVNNNGTIRIPDTSNVVFYGTLSGTGSYTGSGVMSIESGLSPGNSPGLMRIEGDMILGSDASTLIELGGLMRGIEYDAIDVGGSLTLDGELKLVLYDLGAGLLNPSLGDSFDLFSADSIIGDFSSFTLAGLDAGLGWHTELLIDAVGNTDIYRLSIIRTSTVPVPASAWLFGSGLLGLFVLLRRPNVSGVSQSG